MKPSESVPVKIDWKVVDVEICEVDDETIFPLPSNFTPLPLLQQSGSLSQQKVISGHASMRGK